MRRTIFLGVIAPAFWIVILAIHRYFSLCTDRVDLPVISLATAAVCIALYTYGRSAQALRGEA